MDIPQQLFSDIPVILRQILFYVIFLVCVGIWFFLARELARQNVARISRSADKKVEKAEAVANQATGTALVVVVILGSLLSYFLLPLWALSAVIFMGLVQLVTLGLLLLIASLALRRNR